jgi:hypothetical protein
MKTETQDIPFSTFLYVTTAGHLIFAVPAIIGVLLFSLMDTKSLFFILVPIVLISIAMSAAFAWLIAKGSNWATTSTTAGVTAACSLPGRIYGILFGGLLGFHFFGTVGGIIVAILFYFLALVFTIPLGKYFSRKVIPQAAIPTE